MTAPKTDRRLEHADGVLVLDLVTDPQVCAAWLRMTRDNPGGSAMRVVIIDEAGSLGGNFANFQHLYALHSVICVVVGSGDETPPGRVLRLPNQLAQERAAVLWVGDRQGVWWSPDQGRAHHDAERLDGSGLDELVDVLSVADVFDEVVKRAHNIPDATASPGVERVSGSLEPAEVTSAVWQVVSQLTGPSGAPVEPTLRMSREAGPVQTGSSIVADSEFDHARRAVADAGGRAEAAVRRFEGPAGLFGRAAAQGRDRITAFGRSLDRFASLIRDTGAVLDAGARTGTLAATGLAERGFAPVERFEPSETTARLRTMVVGELRDGRSLTDLATDLRSRATVFAPGGAGGAVARVDAVYPDALSRRLAAPAPLSRWTVSPALLPLVGLAAAAGAFLPGAFWLAGPVLAVVWTALVVRAAFSGPTRPRPADLLPAAAQGAVAAAGVLVARSTGLDPLVEITAPLTVACLLALPVLLLASWNRGVRRWQEASGVGEAVRAAAVLDEILETLGREEWRQADERRFVSDAARTIAGGLDEVARMLRSIAEEAGDDEAQRPPRSRFLTPTITDDLADLGLEVLEPIWGSLIARQPRRAGEAGVLTQKLFGDYRAHLSENGVQKPPGFGRMHENREALISDILGMMPEIAELTRRTGHEKMRQLCARRDLSRLLRVGTEIEVVRFAPDLARPGITARDVAPGSALVAGVEGMCWTTGTVSAGVLRLVPLQREEIELYWPEQEEVVG
ncbi:hypothetical protein ACFWMR_31150 [Amycolatopsis thailandensis]|uniref:hypothetical protein n=1 Tax=Amycolatopsis thailandensis TaxID=589330 RepID=UPI003647B78E